MKASARRNALLVTVGCILWLVAAHLFHVWPAGIFYNGQSLESCRNRLQQIYLAKRILALDHGLTSGQEVPAKLLSEQFPNGVPSCPSGGVYTIGRIDEPDSCSFNGTAGPPPQKQYHLIIFWRWRIPPAAPHEYTFEASN